MDIDYSKATLRQLKGMRAYHRKHRVDSRHRILFLKIRKIIKTKQDKYYTEQETLFTKLLIKMLGKFNGNK